MSDRKSDPYTVKVDLQLSTSAAIAKLDDLEAEVSEMVDRLTQKALDSIQKINDAFEGTVP